jgi:hypothetical protein
VLPECGRSRLVAVRFHNLSEQEKEQQDEGSGQHDRLFRRLCPCIVSQAGLRIMHCIERMIASNVFSPES